MPQLDKVSFFIQLISVYFVYSFYFLILLHMFLPNLAKVIKGRKKWTKNFFIKIDNTQKNVKQYSKSLNNNIFKIIGNLKNFMSVLKATFNTKLSTN